MRRLSRAGLALGVAPVLAAGAVGATEAARLGAARRRGVAEIDGVPVPQPSFGLAAAVAADALLTGPMPLLSSLGSADDHAGAGAELDAALAFHAAAGWAEAPLARHRRPPTPEDVRWTTEGRGRGAIEVVRFASGWAPEPGEPGGERWTDAADEVPVRILRHPGGPRPWLVAVHGQSMGRRSDVSLLRVRRLHERLGINVAMPVLPRHGPRSHGLAPRQQFVANVFLVNNVLGLTQAVWDLRRTLAWLREVEEAPAVGVLGVSLGAYVCALLSTVEADLGCVVGVVPTSDLAASLRAAEPVTAAGRRRHRRLHDERSTRLHRVVSPLAGPCLVRRERRHLVIGQVDRVAPAARAVELRRHWEDPSTTWLPRGHVTAWRSSAYDDAVAAFLTSCGLGY